MDSEPQDGSKPQTTLSITSSAEHGSDVFGVAWNPLIRDEYAVGCMDGSV